jgi:hypothetical protein
MDHPVFGKVEASVCNKDGTYYWETSSPLVTPRGAIHITFDAGANGPSDAQVAHWQLIYDDAEALVRSAQPLLLERLQDFHLESHLGDLLWSGIALSSDGSSTSPWQMSFELEVGHSATLTASFVGGIPVTVSFDD